MKNILLFGKPGSGKGTMSALLVQKFGWEHLSTGDIIRSEIEKGSDIGQLADKIIKGGNLLTDDIVINMVKNRVMESDNKEGFLFDGFPRTIFQAKSLDIFLFKRKSPIDKVLYLDVPDYILFERVKGRGRRLGESDNHLNEFPHRLDVYQKATLPVLDYFREQGKISEINANQEVNLVFQEIISQL